MKKKILLRYCVLLDNEAIELEFISVLIYYTYMRKLKKEESMMCRNDKSRVDPKWKTQHLPQFLNSKKESKT